MIEKTAIVTGATGMIGTALLECLIDEGYEVIAVTRPDSKRNGNLPAGRIVHNVKLSIEDYSSLTSAVKSTGIKKADLFFHLAWSGTYGESRNDMDIQTANIKASVEAVRAAAELGCTAFLGAGSQAEYGRVENGKKLAGDTPCHPETGYGIAKLCAGQMTRVEAKNLGIKHIWTRILSVYGPHDGLQTMVMSGITKMVSGERPLYTKGEQVWDYIYCKDAARALYLAALKGTDGAVYPIGSGEPRLLKDYIKAIRDAVEPSLEIDFGDIPYCPGQVMYLCADISALKTDTGFSPEYTFEQGIRETVEWYNNSIEHIGG